MDVLALTPTEDRTQYLQAILEPLGCRVHGCRTPQELGEQIRSFPVGLIVVAGNLPGLSLEHVLTAVRERVPEAPLVVALSDVEQANRLASRFRGHAMAWPVSVEAIGPLLDGRRPATTVTPRREVRWRMLSGGHVVRDGATLPALLLNISVHGAMALADMEAAVGETVALEVPYGVDRFTVRGTVRHVGEYPLIEQALHEHEWLRLVHPRVFGLELDAASREASAEVCRRIQQERQFLELRLLCVPGMPKGLPPVLKYYGVKAEVHQNLPEKLPVTPPIVIMDVSTCHAEEIERLERLRRRALIIGVATTPISDPVRAAFASSLPAIFVLPHQSETLVQHIANFFAPVDRRMPRIDETFSAVLKTERLANIQADGLNLSTNGCAVLVDKVIPKGTALEGVLSMDRAIDAYPFAGRVIYCVAQGDRFRLGVSLQVKDPAAISFQKYLSSRFLSGLRAQWEQMLREPL